MDSISGPVVAGIIVSLLNRYVLDFKWCTLPENWYDEDVEVEVDETDASSSSSTAISSDSILTHHVVTHVH